MYAHRPEVTRAVDDDGLQADVMRFMAIIAFCLVAIMALVREPAVSAQVPTRAPTEASSPAPSTLPSAVEPELTSGTDRSTAPVEPVHHAAALTQTEDVVGERAPSAPEPVTEALRAPVRVVGVPSTREPVARRPVVEAPLRREPIARESVPPEPAPAEPTDVAPVPAAEVAALVPEAALASPEPAVADRQAPPADAAAAPAADPQEGLSLRFASDADFLRLLERRGITLHAFRDGDRLTWSTTGRFVPVQGAQAPRTVHELFARTVPRSIRAALTGLRGAGPEFRWGVTLPSALADEIAAYARAGRSGTLLIDGDGDVRLADPSGDLP